MRGDHDPLVAELRIAPPNHPEHVLGFQRAGLIVCCESGLLLQGHRSKTGLPGSILHDFIGGAIGCEELLCPLQTDPARDVTPRGVIGLQIEALTTPRVDHHEPRIRRRGRLMDNQHRGRTPATCLLELVSPTAVISHSLATEPLRIELVGLGRIGNRRIIDEDDDRLAPHIHITEVIPSVLRSVDPVTHEEHIVFRHRHITTETRAPGHIILRPHQCFSPESKAHRRLHPHDGNILSPRSVRHPWLKTRTAKLLHQITHRLDLTRSTRTTPLELIARQHPSVFEDLCRLDGSHSPRIGRTPRTGQQYPQRQRHHRHPTPP